MNYIYDLLVYVKLFSEAPVGWPTVFTDVFSLVPTGNLENHQFWKEAVCFLFLDIKIHDNISM